MKNINKFFSVGLLFVGGLLAGCTEDIPEREASPVPTDGAQVFVFENTPTNLSFLPADKQEFVIKIGRSESVSNTAASINLVVEDPDGLFNVPSSVTFAAGATEAEVPVTFNFELGQKSSLTVSLADADTYLYGKNNVTISVLRDYVWESAGVASMTSAWAGGPVDIPVRFAKGSNPLRYRLESPYYYLEPDYCPEQGYHLVFELDENYNALNFLEQQYIGETNSDGFDIFIYWASRFSTNTFTNVGNTFTVVAHFLYYTADNSLSGWTNITEQFVWKEGYPGKAGIDFNTLTYEEIPGAVSSFTSTAFYNESWDQPLAKAIDLEAGNEASPYKNLYYLADLYADGFGLAFYNDGGTIRIPGNQPTGTTFKKPLYISQSENIESSVAISAKGVATYTFGLKFHYEDGTVVGEFAETFFYSKDPVSYAIADFYGNYHLTAYSQFDGTGTDMSVAIAAGASENTLVIKGIDYAPSGITATFDPKTSTMSIAPQELIDKATYQGNDYVLTLFTTTPDGDISDEIPMEFTFNMSGNLVFSNTSEADGYLLDLGGLGWWDGYYDLKFTPAAQNVSPAKSSSDKPTNKTLKKAFTAKKASVANVQKCTKGNFAVQAKASSKKTLKRASGTPIL